jgi:hypothetical protein
MKSTIAWALAIKLHHNGEWVVCPWTKLTRTEVKERLFEISPGRKRLSKDEKIVRVRITAIKESRKIK